MWKKDFEVKKRKEKCKSSKIRREKTCMMWDLDDLIKLLEEINFGLKPNLWPPV